MALALGILTVMAGIGYILWQVHKESKGTISSVLIFILIVCGPLLLLKLAGELCPTLGIILGIILIAGLVFYAFEILVTGDKRSKDKLREMAKESQQIWDEVYKLPLPDEDTIRAYKLANKIPLYPEDCKVYTDAAIEKWRISEYNKRYKEKHKFVFYVK